MAMLKNLEPVLPRTKEVAPLPRHAMPVDVESYEQTLQMTRVSIVGFASKMEHMFFGFVGLDPVISLVPVVGDAAASLLCLWLLMLGRRVRLPAEDKAIIVGLAFADFAVGCIPVAGDILDIFFRSHAWSAERVIQHIDAQLALIGSARSQLAAKSGEPSDTNPTLVRLRDVLFRGGRTERQVNVRLLAIIGICLALLTYCGFNNYLRNQNIAACEARGAWFCSSRY